MSPTARSLPDSGSCENFEVVILPSFLPLQESIVNSRLPPLVENCQKWLCFDPKAVAIGQDCGLNATLFGGGRS